MSSARERLRFICVTMAPGLISGILKLNRQYESELDRQGFQSSLEGSGDTSPSPFDRRRKVREAVKRKVRE